jgi:hypothetical protein
MDADTYCNTKPGMSESLPLIKSDSILKLMLRDELKNMTFDDLACSYVDSLSEDQITNKLKRLKDIKMEGFNGGKYPCALHFMCRKNGIDLISAFCAAHESNKLGLINPNITIKCPHHESQLAKRTTTVNIGNTPHTVSHHGTYFTFRVLVVVFLISVLTSVAVAFITSYQICS